MRCYVLTCYNLFCIVFSIIITSKYSRNEKLERELLALHYPPKIYLWVANCAEFRKSYSDVDNKLVN